MADKDIAAIAGEVFALLEPRSAEERQKVVRAAFALLGEQLPGIPAETRRTEDAQRSGEQAGDTPGLGPRASSWARQHKLTHSDLERAFYFHDGKVDTVLNEVPGNSKREQTINCYLLVGLKAFLEGDSPKFTDADAMVLCKHTRAYDKNNHPKFRNALGNLVNGSKDDGFELAGPGLKAVGELVAALRQGKSE